MKGQTTINEDTGSINNLNFHFQCFVPLDTPCFNYNGQHPPQ